MKYPRYIRREAAVAEGMNWTLVTGRHLKWYDPAGIMRVTTAMTPSGGKRTIANTKAKLKQFGIRA